MGQPEVTCTLFPICWNPLHNSASAGISTEHPVGVQLRATCYTRGVKPQKGAKGGSAHTCIPFKLNGCLFQYQRTCSTARASNEKLFDILQASVDAVAVYTHVKSWTDRSRGSRGRPVLLCYGYLRSCRRLLQIELFVTTDTAEALRCDEPRRNACMWRPYGSHGCNNCEQGNYKRMC